MQEPAVQRCLMIPLPWRSSSVYDITMNQHRPATWRLAICCRRVDTWRGFGFEFRVAFVPRFAPMVPTWRQP